MQDTEKQEMKSIFDKIEELDNFLAIEDLE